MKVHLRTAWEQLSLYLPVLLMGVFALGTWWLVRSTPEASEAQAGVVARHEADYFLRQFAIKTFDRQGQFKSELSGQEAQHYPDTDTLEITRVEVHSVSLEGQRTVATADRAISNADGSEVQLLGNVHVVRQVRPDTTSASAEPMEYRSEFLQAFTQTDQLKSPMPVVITQGDNRFSGNAMSYDHSDGLLELRGQVHSTLAPHPKR